MRLRTPPPITSESLTEQLQEEDRASKGVGGGMLPPAALEQESSMLNSKVPPHQPGEGIPMLERFQLGGCRLQSHLGGKAHRWNPHVEG